MYLLSGFERRSNLRRQAAFTLIELMIAVAIIVALSTIAFNSYQAHREKARVNRAIAEIANIARAIEAYRLDARAYPPTLNALRISTLNDPWGRPYRYLPIDVVPPPNTGLIRRDKNLNPLNTDYDLYSLGRDGETQMQLTASKARDDVVRANNGAFIGLGANH